MKIGYQMLKTENPIVVMCLHYMRRNLMEILKKTVIVRSTMKFEFIALNKCWEEA